MKKLLCLASVVALPVYATADGTLELAGIESWDAQGAAGNHSVSFDVGAGTQVISVNWSGVMGDGLGGPSWGNEMLCGVLTDTGGVIGIGFFPGEGSASAGGIWGPSDGDADISTFDVIAGADGMITIEFYEGYDDAAGVIDAAYTAGTLNFVTEGGGPSDPCEDPLPELCQADIAGDTDTNGPDGLVNVADVLAVIGTWGLTGDGTNRPQGDCAPYDPLMGIHGDCTVNVADVLAVVAGWGGDCTPPPVYGSCCLADESCIDTTAGKCSAGGGTYNGDNTDCASTSCEISKLPGDECATALVAIDGANPFDTTTMTASQPQPDDSMCSTSALAWDESPDVWFVWTASVDDTYNIRTCENGTHDTSMVLYEGSCTNQIACNGDFGDGTGNGGECTAWYSQIDLDATAGTTYYIRLGGWQGAAGAGTLNINVQPPPLPGACCYPDETCLDNLDSDECAAFGGTFAGEATACADDVCLAGAGDECLDAVVVLTGSTPFDTTLMTPSTPEPDESQCAGTYLAWSGSNDVWFEWVATGDVLATFSTCTASGGYDTSIALYEGDCDTQVACNGDEAGEAGCQAYYAAIYDHPVTAGTSYFIRIGGYGGASGAATLTITDCDGALASACCLGGGVCDEVDRDTCLAAGGTPFCGSACADMTCYGGCPADSVDEGAPCFVDGDDSATDPNGGLNAPVPVYGDLYLGTSICGTAPVYVDGPSGGTYRDLDWYSSAGVNAGGTFTFTLGTSGLDMIFGIIDLDTGGSVAGAFWQMPGSIEDSVVSAAIPPGNYAVLAGPASWNTAWTCASGDVEYFILVE